MGWPFSWAKQSVTRVRPGVKTVRGSDLPDWDNASELTINGCSMQPAATDLTQDKRVLGVLDGYTCYMPANADVKAGDRIVFEGNTYTIDGEPRIWTSATGNISNMLLNLQRWDG